MNFLANDKKELRIQIQMLISEYQGKITVCRPCFAHGREMSQSVRMAIRGGL